MNERQLDLDDLAPSLGLSAGDTRSLLAGALPLTLSIARNLSASVGGTTEFWMTREAQYQDDLARVRADKWSQDLPVAQMVRLGWMQKPSSWLDQIDTCLRFFDVPDIDTWEERYDRQVESAHFRSSSAFDLKAGATTAWFRAGDLVAESGPKLPAFDSQRLTALLPWLRDLTRVPQPEKFVSELVSLCAGAGLHVVVLPTPKGCSASGVARRLHENPLIQLSARHLTDDHFWFTFFHEVGHVLHHDLEMTFIDNLDDRDHLDVFEDEANEFASEFLMGRTSMRWNGALSRREIVRIAHANSISPGIVVGQFQYRGLLRPNQHNGLKRRYVWNGATLETRRRT
ncbi:ImmA/IrrE family metallo-endopeptidase [Nocardioides sediminis]|uniref:ImmA/IrrE family metallo-endopeptidase n=1 Tax=Nocardioides sediminis TaxID=433648 RepID=UPI001F410969|nr:ImmA/IrrE family metallo-endopeptidase [Nocardioides sediminis]